MKKLYILFLILVSFSAESAEIDIPEHLWRELDSTQQLSISNKYTVNIYPQFNYGVLIDVQVLNKSTSGTNAGSTIGSAYAQSRYIDNSFSGNSFDYSATKQLGYGLLGAIVGSLLDEKAVSKYQTRYTVKLANNTIQTFDDASSTENFSQSRGICVTTNPLKLANQLLCDMTKDEILLLAGGKALESFSASPNRANVLPQQTLTKKVKCKIGDNSPTFIDENLCISAKGEIL